MNTNMALWNWVTLGPRMPDTIQKTKSKTVVKVSGTPTDLILHYAQLFDKCFSEGSVGGELVLMLRTVFFSQI